MATTYESLTKEELVAALTQMHQRLLELEGRLQQTKEETKWLEDAIKRRTGELNERVKELNCLYQISSILEGSPSLTPEIFQRLTELIPQAWRYSQYACARIRIGDREFKTLDFNRTAYRQACDICVKNRRIGEIEVCYFKAPGKMDSTPFLNEEFQLLGEIAHRIGKTLESSDPNVSLNLGK